PGGAAMSEATTETLVQVLPPSVERSSAIVSNENCCLGSVVVRVVHTEPSGVTCGSRYVAPCGVVGACGSGIGADQAVCVPSMWAWARETTGGAVNGPVKSTHIA